MKRIVYFFVVWIMVCVFSSVVFAETVDEIEKILVGYKGSGYSFVKKIGNGSWKVNLKIGEYSRDIYVYVSGNNTDTDYDVVYISSTVKAYRNDSVLVDNAKDLIFALVKNAGQGEWGSFSLFKDENSGWWYLDYNVKIRRVYAFQSHLINAITWVAAASIVYDSMLKK